VLTTLVERYETANEPIDPPDPIEALKYYMESRGLKRRDLEAYLGSRARVAEVLNRRRPLSIEMIRKLHGGLGIPAEILIRPYKIRKPAA
jgi:HTH-type transcriptional regulator / antitoxin HigA